MKKTGRVCAGLAGAGGGAWCVDALEPLKGTCRRLERHKLGLSAEYLVLSVCKLEGSLGNMRDNLV